MAESWGLVMKTDAQWAELERLVEACAATLPGMTGDLGRLRLWQVPSRDELDDPGALRQPPRDGVLAVWCATAGR